MGRHKFPEINNTQILNLITTVMINWKLVVRYLVKAFLRGNNTCKSKH